MQAVLPKADEAPPPLEEKTAGTVGTEAVGAEAAGAAAATSAANDDGDKSEEDEVLAAHFAQHAPM